MSDGRYRQTINSVELHVKSDVGPACGGSFSFAILMVIVESPNVIWYQLMTNSIQIRENDSCIGVAERD